MKTLIIDRARWLNADTTSDTTCLYDSATKKMCCLGFAARQLAGAKVKDIIDLSSPASCETLAWPEGLAPTDYIGDNGVVVQLMELNDTDAKTPKVREERIAKEFAKIGIRVKYIGKYPKKVSK